MSEVLSVEEIKALLGACQMAENEGRAHRASESRRSVRPYDFARPDKFSRDHIKALRAIHSKYAACSARR